MRERLWIFCVSVSAVGQMCSLKLSMSGSVPLLCSSSRSLSAECRSPGTSCPGAVCSPARTWPVWRRCAAKERQAYVERTGTKLEAAAGVLSGGNLRPWSTFAEQTLSCHRNRRGGRGGGRTTPEASAAASGWDLETENNSVYASNFSNLKFSSEMKYETKSFQVFFFQTELSTTRGLPLHF